MPTSNLNIAWAEAFDWREEGRCPRYDLEPSKRPAQEQGSG